MKIPVADLPPLLTKFVEESMLPKLKGTPAAFALGAGALLMQQSAHAAVHSEKSRNFLAGSGLLDAEGLFDLDKARNAAMKGMEAAGGTLPVTLWNLPFIGGLTYSFDADDIETLYKLAQ